MPSMQSSHGYFRAPVWLAAGIVAANCAACQPVKEDRTVTWSAQGESVGFQHGEEGIFIADREGQGLQRVYQPGPEVIASSTPLWSPTDRRLIFTTAQDAGQRGQQAIPRLTQGDPSGDTFAQMPVIYTCWLREAALNEGASGEEPPDPRPLFEAACDHVGYVAANLAVRWHPAGDKIVFIDQIDARHHGLFTYDLASSVKRQIHLPAAAEALVFDWRPDNVHLACLLASEPQSAASDGLWIGRIDESGWWRVPGAEALARPWGGLPRPSFGPDGLGRPPHGVFSDSLLERLKSSRPRWSRDGRRFVFVTAASNAAASSAPCSRIWLGDLATHDARLIAETEDPVDDLAWSPDGERLGLIRGGGKSGLAMLTLDGQWLPSMQERAARRFIGWDAAGRWLAYVTSAEIPYAGDDGWALLLAADPQSRDAVLVAPDDGKKAPREVVSGLHVTFPHWSPREEKLSLWFTFSPSHRSLLSRWLGGGLLPGDPAATVDVATGRIDWMAVSPREEAQIGHYHLLKRDYAEAWRRYERAAEEEPEPDVVAAPLDFFQRLQPPRDLRVFEYVCLRKLDRGREASERLAAFRNQFPPDPSPLPTGAAGETADAQPIEAPLRELLAQGGLAASLMQDLYLAEVCLSVDAPGEAEWAFRERLKHHTGPMARLSAAIVLAQILLLEERYDEYLGLAIDAIVPATLRSWRAGQAAPQWPTFDAQGVLALAAGLTLLPLASDEFLAGMDDLRIVELAEALDASRAEAADETSALAIDLALLAAYERLNDVASATAAKARISANPASVAWGPAADLRQRIADLRRELQRQNAN